MITIVLADDHQIVRQGIRTLLEDEPDLHVIGEAADGIEAARLVKSLQPDILVVDLKMPGLNGIEVTRQAREHSPKTGVVILSMYRSKAYVLEVLNAGAKGYVVKESTSDELVRAIHEADDGHIYLSPPLSEEAIEIYKQKRESTGF